MLAGSALVAPRLQLYTYLMCKDLDDTAYGRMGSTRTIPCAADPVVQVNVAKFLTSQCVIRQLQILRLMKSKLVTATVEGILSCLTATFWGSVRALINPSHRIPPETFKFSDRYGRVKFLGLNITTLLLADAALAVLAVAPEYVPGGYWFLLFTSAFEGVIGGKCCIPRVRQT
jgi:hypothetical protein